MQIGVNHLGHFALAGRLMPMLLDTSGSRVVVISSVGHRSGRMNFDDLEGEKSYTRSGAYFQSKQANLLYMNELQRRLDAADADTIATAAHPGISTTNLTHGILGGWVDRVFHWTAPLTNLVISQSPEGGALPTLRDVPHTAAPPLPQRPGGEDHPLALGERALGRRGRRSCLNRFERTHSGRSDGGQYLSSRVRRCWKVFRFLTSFEARALTSSDTC